MQLNERVMNSEKVDIKLFEIHFCWWSVAYEFVIVLLSVKVF